MEKNKFKKIKQGDKYDWMVMPDSYFAAALLCCDTLVHSENNLNTNARQIMDSSAFKEFRSRHSNCELIRPIIFNFKQGIELYVKGIAGMLAGEYAYCHDIRDIFEHGIQLAKTSDYKYKFLTDLHKETWPIIEKYYYGLYIPTHTDYGHPDKLNISERYPRCGIGYDLGDYFLWVTIEKIEEIKKDIYNLEKIFSKAKRQNYFNPKKIIIK